MTRREAHGLIVWSMWRVRLAPWREVSKNDQVWLVERHASGRWIGWETRVAWDPQTSDYRDKQWAATLVKVRFGLNPSEFLNHPYTKQAHPYGYLLACELAAIRKVDVALPRQLKLSRNGWTNLDDIPGRDLRRWGLLQSAKLPSARGRTA